ncbi:hypothetical protein BCY86_01155 [Pajaroellobacter abortibovis]|uniref:Cytochrome c domain-containing protein n=1 Tax=Pajaroellobacter abortibovis TaxID=1882918 RepID=A0A1L6MZ00_9BACT|nr:hypothetical protein BCY86_01155 [Pajaroellobacter abortibovis]
MRKACSLLAQGGLLLALQGMGCRGQTSEEPPALLVRNMWSQPRYNAQSYSHFFPDHRTMRTPVEGTISREQEVDDPEVLRGRLEDDSGYVLAIPTAVMERLGGSEKAVKVGQDRFARYCTPCHGINGEGDGIIVSRGLNKPPSFREERLRHAPDGQLYATISHGVRTMPEYGSKLTVSQRWAVVHYVRALQLSLASTDKGEHQP